MIAFLAMEVGVYPRTLHAFVLLRRLVRPRPIALAISPQSGEGECDSGWRVGFGERLAEVVHGHVGYSVTQWRNAARLSFSQTHYQSSA